MTRIQSLGLLAVLAAAVVLASARDDDEAPLRGATFKTWGYELALTELDAESDVDFTRKRPTRHSVRIKGLCRMPADVDAVAAARRMRVTALVDARGNSPIVPPKVSSGKSAPSRYRMGTFGPVAEKTRIAPVEIDKLDLTRSSYTIARMAVDLLVVVARKRRGTGVPAAVMEKHVEIADGLAVRITSLRMSAKRELSLSLEYARRGAGPVGPFLTAVHAIGSGGGVVGGGRLREGDPMGSKGRISVRFELAGEQKIKSLRLTAVTDSKIRRVPFELTGVFQK